MRFADIPGHDDVKQRLRSLADTGRIPHALLLEGPPGIGKFALARAFAQYIHCDHRTPQGDSCGRCPACLQHASFNHIDTIYSFPIIKKGSASLSNDFIDEFRDFLSESHFMDIERWQQRFENVNGQLQIFVDEAEELIRRLNYTAHGSRYKIVLMWLPERLKVEAANKLLKVVEEPYADTLFLFVSNNSRLILPTIYSRTQRIVVPRYDDAELASVLVQQGLCAPDTAADVARLAAGNVNAAVNLVNVSKDSERFLDLFKDLMRKAYTRQVAGLKSWAAEVAALGREREMRFLEYCARLIRENFIYNLSDPQLVYLNRSEMEFSSKFAPFINERNAEDLFCSINDARIDIAANANAKLVNFDLAVKTILLLKR